MWRWDHWRYGPRAVGPGSVGDTDVPSNDEPTGESKALCTRHLQFAWWSLFCFAVLGVSLELLHALKIGWYLGQASETRRLLWTLAHAHGTLLSLVHAAFAFTAWALPRDRSRRRRIASALLMAASVLLPGGFFLGGTFLYEGDPGLGVWLVPPGAAALGLAVLLTAIDVVSDQGPGERTEPSGEKDTPGF